MIPRVHLAEVAQINPRLPKGTNEAQEVSFLAMASVSEDGKILEQETRILGETRKGYTYFARGDVLLAKITPCFENGKAAHVENLEHPIGFGSTEFHVLRPNSERLDAKYLFYLVWSDRFRFLGQKVMKGAAGHKRVPADFLINFEIPLPPLDDQKRIAHLLSKVEGLITQRKQNLQQLDDLLKSVFIEMFGDPVRNEKKWTEKPCTEVVIDIQSGTSYGGEEKEFIEDDEYGVLKISAVTQGVFNSREFKTVKKSAIKKPLRFVTKGDFLFSRANTIELVAACCIVDREYPNLFIPDKLWALSFAEFIVPQYFNFLLKNESFRNQIRKKASGGHDSMLNISMKKFYSLNIPVPPKPLQQKFTTIVDKIDAVKSQYQRSLADLENLYGALSQKAFKGELDLSRVPMPEMDNDLQVTDEIKQESIEQPQEKITRKKYSFTNPVERETSLCHLLDELVGEYKGRKFSLDEFWQYAESKLTEEIEEENKPFGVDDYDIVKQWLFETIEQGQIVQRFSRSNKQIELRVKG